MYVVLKECSLSSLCAHYSGHLMCVFSRVNGQVLHTRVVASNTAGHAVFFLCETVPLQLPDEMLVTF